MPAKTSVAIIYGFAEGPRHGRALRRDLEAADFIVLKRPDEADIILTHSGGCYLVPMKNRAKSMIVVGPPFWPGKSPFVRYLFKTVRDFAANVKRRMVGYWLRKTLLNLVYLVLKPRDNLAIIRHLSTQPFYENIGQVPVMAVRNEHDDGCTPEISNLLAKDRRFSVITVLGQHDDLWLDARPIVEIATDIRLKLNNR